MDEVSKVMVAVRIRPKLDKFNERYQIECVKKTVNEDSESKCVIISQYENNILKNKAFTFDQIFDQDSTQEELYRQTILELVDYAIQGCDVTIFTYGQTGSGKTHTVLGSVGTLKRTMLMTPKTAKARSSSPNISRISSEDMITKDSGIFLRILGDLFKYKKETQSIDVEVKVSILEIYLESFRDLLTDTKKEVFLRETEDSASLPDLRKIPVDSIEEVYRLYKYAEKNRVVACTSMNDVSSRSHCMFFLDITQHEVGTSKRKSVNIQSISSRICIVDLAGSERIKKSEVEGIHMKEAQSINKSLSVLGNVINGLYLEKKHIPFRDSKLTRILKPSFLGRKGSKILLIANLSPTASSVNESLSTLRFADRVKEIKTLSNISTRFETEEQKKQAAYISLLRENERLSATLRVAIDAFGYKAQLIHRKLIDEETFEKEEDTGTTAREGLKEFMRYLRHQDDEKKCKDELLLQEEANNLIKEQGSDIDAKIQKLRDKMACIRRSVEEAKEKYHKGIRELQKQLDNEERVLIATKEEIIRKIQEKMKLEESLTTLQERKEHLEKEVMDGYQSHSNEISKEVNEWNREELQMEIAIHRHNCEKQLVAALVEVRGEQIKYHSLVQRNQALRNRLEEVGEQVMFYQIREFSKVLVYGMIEDAVKMTELERLMLNDDDELRLRKVMSKRYPYDKDDILSQVLDYLKSGCVLGWRNHHNLKQFFYLENDGIWWRESSDEPINSNTVSCIPLNSITHVTLGKYECNRKNRNSLRMLRFPSRSSSSLTIGSIARAPSEEEDYYLSFTVHYAKGRKFLDVSAENSFDFEAWILGLSTLLEIEPQWGTPLEDIGDLDESLSDEDVDFCRKNHIRTDVFEYVRHIVEYLNVKEGTRLSRGQLRVLSKLDIIRSNVLFEFFYAT